MTYLLFFICTYILVYLFYNIFVIRKNNALKKMKSSKEIKLLIKIGNIDINKVDFKRIVKFLALGNSFIISIMATIILVINEFIENFYLWIIASVIIGFILLIPFIVIVYKLIGNILKKERL